MIEDFFNMNKYEGFRTTPHEYRDFKDMEKILLSRDCFSDSLSESLISKKMIKIRKLRKILSNRSSTKIAKACRKIKQII